MATMKKITEKLANARVFCPGMSKDFYLLTDYMSANYYDELDPIEMIMMTVCVRDDLKRGRNGFGGEFPYELDKRKSFVIDEIKWIPQLVDAIADEDFAKDFRQVWKETFGVVPPKRVNTHSVETEKQYPEYVKAAIDWWANAIISPKFDNGEKLPAFLSIIMGSVKEYSQEEIKLFKEALAKGIIEEMDKFKNHCTISVDYHPCSVLAEAGKIIGVTQYPVKTIMQISRQEVSVSAGYGAPYELLWKESK